MPQPQPFQPTVTVPERLTPSLRALRAALRLTPPLRALGAALPPAPSLQALLAALRPTPSLRALGAALLTVAAKLAAAGAKGRAARTRRRPGPATLLLMVGLPGAGKTTQARELAAAHRALRLTPDEWMIRLFGEPTAGRKRDILEGQLILVALEALRLGTSVVLDFGLWGRDERSALRWLAAAAGATGRVVYLPVGRDVQRARIAHRQATAPHTTFPMTEADIDTWRTQFQVPDAAELAGGDLPGPPPGWPGWPEWAADRWPPLAAVTCGFP